MSHVLQDLRYGFRTLIRVNATVFRLANTLFLKPLRHRLVLALGLTRFIGSVLYGLSPTDPVAFGGVILLLTLVACLAAFVPARRDLCVVGVRAG